MNTIFSCDGNIKSIQQELFENMNWFVYGLMKTETRHKNVNFQYFSIGAIIYISRIRFCIKITKKTYPQDGYFN